LTGSRAARRWYAIISGVALAVAVVAVALGLSYRQATNDALDVQVLIGDIQNLSALEWEAIATLTPESELVDDIETLQTEATKSLIALTDRRSLHPGIGKELDALLRAINAEMAMLQLGDVDGAKELDEAVVDPTFDHLIEILEEEGRSATSDASGALRVTGLLMLATIGVGVVAAGVSVRRIEQANALDLMVSSKDRFIATVSHELRTPLTAILGMAELLDSDSCAIDPAERQELLMVIVDQSKEMSYIIEDLLVAARSDIGALATVRADTVLEHEVGKVIDGIGFDESKTVTFDFEEGLMISSDSVRLRQVIRNVLTNANRYGGDRINVRSFQDEDCVWLEVFDNGPGIQGLDLAEVFEPFAQSGGRGPTGSVGIGLYVARTLMELMGGSLTLSQTSAGPTFRLGSPRASARHTPTPTPALATHAQVS
jgi:signal transduction histidine kinase